MKTYILLTDCADEAGIVYKVTGVLYAHKCNIISNDEFVDKSTNHFFMRTEFLGDIDQNEIVAEIKKSLDFANISLVEKKEKDIIILASKEHHCAGDLILRHHYGELGAHIKAVISNHQVLQGLAENFGIPFYFIPHEGLAREAHEEKILSVIAKYNPYYLVLAKYMRILSKNFVERFTNRIINIHHSFLPAFIGASPYKQAHERGVKIIGATAHFVTEGLDAGPIIAQDVIPVNHRLEVEDMVRAGRDVEKKTLATALNLALDDRIFVINNRTIIFG